MEIINLINNNHSTQLLFFNGWGFDENGVNHLTSSTMDVKVIQNYAHLNLQPIFNNHNYTKTIVIAWSFGVYIANQTLPPNTVDELYAINGTPQGVHQTMGIDPVLFDATLKHLSPDSLQRFQMRVMGGASGWKLNANYLPKRSFESALKELQFFSCQFQNPIKEHYKWSNALCSTKDLIFPYPILESVWADKCLTIHHPHYIFNHYQSWEQLLNTLQNE